MNKIPNSSDMIGEYFREWKSFSYQSRYSLSHGIIKSFYIVCLASILSYYSMSFLRKNYPIRKDRSLYNLQHIDDIPLARESQSPWAPVWSLFPIYTPTIYEGKHINCQPNPLLITLISYKWMTASHHIELLADPFFLTLLLLVFWRLPTFC
jgi:hypothetical protein